MTKLAFAVVSLALCGSLGCNQIADINDPQPKGGTPGTGTTPAGASGTPAPSGTGTGTSETPPPGGGDTSKFVGTWTVKMDANFTNCTNGGPGPQTGTTSLTITASSNGIKLSDGQSCTTDFTVNANVATAVAGSSGNACSGTMGSLEYESTVKSGSITLAGNGTAATLKLGGTVDFWDSAAESTCEFTQTGQLTKNGGS